MAEAVAAPVFHDVAEAVAAYLHIPPDISLAKIEVADRAPDGAAR